MVRIRFAFVEDMFDAVFKIQEHNFKVHRIEREYDGYRITIPEEAAHLI